MKDVIAQAVQSAAEKNYFEFEKSVTAIIQDKINNHPGVQAYKEDLKYYQDYTAGLPKGEPTPEEDPEPTPEEEPEPTPEEEPEPEN